MSNDKIFGNLGIRHFIGNWKSGIGYYVDIEDCPDRSRSS